MSPCLLFHSDLAGKGFSSGHCRQENRAFAKQAAQARSQQLSQLSPASTPRMAPHCFPSYAPSGSHRKHGAVPQSDPCWFLTSPNRAEGQTELPKLRRARVFSVSPPPGTPGPVEGQAEGSNCASHAHLSGRVPTACSLLSGFLLCASNACAVLSQSFLPQHLLLPGIPTNVCVYPFTYTASFSPFHPSLRGVHSSHSISLNPGDPCSTQRNPQCSETPLSSTP